MSESINNTMNTQQPATTPTPEARGGQDGAKMFTQDEVNRIVSERLARERAKTEPSQEDEREKALKAREARLDCREYLESKNYPNALLDALDHTDAAKFKATVDKLIEAFPSIIGSQTKRDGWAPGSGKRITGQLDSIAAAFKPKI